MSTFIITPEGLRYLLSYDPETGEFTRLVATSPSVRVGSAAGCVDSKGYCIIRVWGRPYKAHRLAFLYMTGRLPEGDVDHINGVPGDNRWCNLRIATRSENIANSRRSKSNSSGFKGVHWHKPLSKWCARICVGGKRILLGYFDEPEAARIAYALAASNYFGEFGNDGRAA